MEKYKNRREVRRVGGRFAKPKTLQQQGFDINSGGQICTICNRPNLSILRSDVCRECQNQASK